MGQLQSSRQEFSQLPKLNCRTSRGRCVTFSMCKIHGVIQYFTPIKYHLFHIQTGGITIYRIYTFYTTSVFPTSRGALGEFSPQPLEATKVPPSVTLRHLLLHQDPSRRGPHLPSLSVVLKCNVAHIGRLASFKFTFACALVPGWTKLEFIWSLYRVYSYCTNLEAGEVQGVLLMQEPTTWVQNTAGRCWNDTGNFEEHIHVGTLGITRNWQFYLFHD